MMKNATKRSDETLASRAALSRITLMGERDSRGRLLPLRYRVAEAVEARTVSVETSEYEEGYRDGKRDAHEGSVEAAQMYLQMTKPRPGDEYDAGHRAAFVERAAES